MITILAVLSFGIGLFILVFDHRRLGARPFDWMLAQTQRWSLSRLLLASFVTLFAELALIRWMAVEIRVFAYFKNLTLVLCFLGFGLGCALAGRPLRWLPAVKSILALLIAVRLPVEGWRNHLHGLSQHLSAASDIEIWRTGTASQWAEFIIAAFVASVLLLFLATIFVPLGQVVGHQLEMSRRRLPAYSWNLLGSLAGILVFFAASHYMIPPAVWFGVVLAGMSLLQQRLSHGILVASLILPAVALLRDTYTPDHFSVWTPYQQIEVNRVNFPDGEWLGHSLWVNHTGYQTIINLSPDFLSRHPGLLKEAADDNPYNLPFRFSRPSPRVLIMGAGSGNDTAAALRNGSVAVDAVEIDPAIVQVGRDLHPERPYESPRVSLHVADARAFLKRTSHLYDLIIFGLLDSHTQFSDYSNMRIDNFVYTEEAFREARRRLSPDGVLFVKFEVNRPWMGKRLAQLLTRTFDKQPLVFFADSSYTVSATCFVISPSGRVEAALGGDPRLSGFVGRPPAFLETAEVAVPTDDWPYLYHEGQWIPRLYYTVSLFVILLGLFFFWQVPEAREHRPSLFFFSMGAAFLLLETQIISRLALHFGTTWQVNGIVIGALLAMLLLANAVAERWPSLLQSRWLVAGVLGGLATAYLLPLNQIPGPTAFAGGLAAAAFSLPVFFAGLLFAGEFRKTRYPSAALAANMLGALAGGLLENLSLIMGMNALLLVAFSLYGLAAWSLRKTELPFVPAGTQAPSRPSS